MRLADIELAASLKTQLAELEDWHGPGTLMLSHREIELDADAVAAYVEYRRTQIERELFRLGIDVQSSGSSDHPPAGPAVDRAPVAATGVEVWGREAPARLPPRSPGEAREQATRYIMGAAWDDWKAGRYDDPGDADPAAAGDRKFAGMVQRRAPEIEAAVAAMSRSTPVYACSRCKSPATSVVAGEHLCDEHARTTVRLPLPQAFRRIFSS